MRYIYDLLPNDPRPTLSNPIYQRLLQSTKAETHPKYLHNIFEILNGTWFFPIRYTFDRESAMQVDDRVQDYLFLMAVSNSCMNPLVYGSYAMNFRRECARCCGCFFPKQLDRKSTGLCRKNKRSIIVGGWVVRKIAIVICRKIALYKAIMSGRVREFFCIDQKKWLKNDLLLDFYNFSSIAFY